MKTKEEIQQMLDETVNTLLGQHRGRVDIVSIDTVEGVRVASFRMAGGCQGCAGAKATMKSVVTNYVKQFDDSIGHILDVTDHTDKTNAFFKE